MSSEIDNKMEKLYDDIFRERGLVPSDPVDGLNPEGSSYTLLPEIGQGYCWIYNVNGYVSISIVDQLYFKETMSEIQEPESLTIGYYDAVSGTVLTPYHRVLPGVIHAHAGANGPYRFMHNANTPMRGISVTMMPEFYKQYLREKFGREYKDPGAAFAAIDGIHVNHEFVEIFSQIRNYRGSGMSAKIYYESKVGELLALVYDTADAKSRLHKEHWNKIKNHPGHRCDSCSSLLYR